MSGLKIVRTTRNRVADVAPLFHAYRRYYQQRSDEASCRGFLLERVDKAESVIFLALVNGKVVGFAQLYPSFSSVWMKRLWILNDLFVVPKARRHRVGTALLDASRQLAKKTGAKGLILETKKDNLRAQRLYEKLGWTRDEMFYHYYLEA